MTVCIAAVCGAAFDRTIILCTDGKASNALGSKEAMLKDRALAKGWRCLSAGTDFEINSLLPLFEARIRGLAKVDETNIKPAIEGALQERKTQKADQYTRLKWGLSFEEFRKAKAQFPEEEFRADIQAIGAMEIEADCIIAGFLDDGLPMLLQAHGKYGVEIREDYAVAGEGAHLAQSVLMHREHYDFATLPEAIYTVYEAKRYAERVSSVGKMTLLAFFKPAMLPRAISEAGYRYLGERFEEFGPKPVGASSVNLKDEHFFDMPL